MYEKHVLDHVYRLYRQPVVLPLYVHYEKLVLEGGELVRQRVIFAMCAVTHLLVKLLIKEGQIINAYGFGVMLRVHFFNVQRVIGGITCPAAGIGRLVVNVDAPDRVILIGDVDVYVDILSTLGNTEFVNN